MSSTKSRLFGVSLLCLSICGCASTGVGTPLPSGGASKFLLYAPPGAQLSLAISEIPGYQIFAPDPNYDKHPKRPPDTDPGYVAYTAIHHLDGGVTYHADLMTWSTLYDNWQFYDEVDPFTANELILIYED